ncbi:site-2 protease family protein [Candidatus Dependentiae bacterium]|nr:site-2 protease family protein [Candidatus Dependentiae bacterium]
MEGNQFLSFLAGIIIIFPAFLIALSFHEFAHAFVAYLLGDDTAKRQGRMTLNPFAHLDFLGTVFLLLFRIGWARPVPFNIENFKHPRFYSILTGLAGPTANFIVAIIAFIFMKFISFLTLSKVIFVTFMQILEATAYINVMLGTFNLLPIPPLDGSHFIFALLYKRFPKVLMFLYRYSLFILLLIFLLPVTRALLIQVILGVYDFLKNLVL